jgi:AcrR family transcriptional regulator
LLEAAVNLLVTDGTDEFSLREVAKRAGVSAPTAYRHFPTKDAMYEALQVYFEDRVGDPRSYRDVEGLVEDLPAIHAGLSNNADVTTAYVRSGAAHLRDAGRKRRAKRIGSIVKASLPSLSGEELQAFCAVVQLFVSTASWEIWRGTWQLEGARAGRVAAWAVRTLYEQARKNPKAFAAAVRGDARTRRDGDDGIRQE